MEHVDDVTADKTSPEPGACGARRVRCTLAAIVVAVGGVVSCGKSSPESGASGTSSTATSHVGSTGNAAGSGSGAAGGSASGSAGSNAKPPSPFLTFLDTAPIVGDVAPAFTLATADGAKTSLETLTAAGPVVIVFASFTCPPSRMKQPRFEQLAKRWAGKASVVIVYQEEAHPHAASMDRLVGFAAQVQALDKDRDNATTLAELGTTAPRFMFDAFDLDRDGTVHAHELLAARRLEQFKDIEAPKTYEERALLAKKFRAEVPGSIPVLVDTIDNATSKAYGELPNSAYVIAKDGRVAFKVAWAAAGEVEAALAKLTGAQPPIAEAPDLAPIAPVLAAAKAAKKSVLLELVSPGCEACKTMDATTLADLDVKTALGRYEVARLGIEHDATWRLFEQLDLAATPAFVIVTPDGTLGARVQGLQDRERFLAFLTPK